MNLPFRFRGLSYVTVGFFSVLGMFCIYVDRLYFECREPVCNLRWYGLLNQKGSKLVQHLPAKMSCFVHLALSGNNDKRTAHRSSAIATKERWVS
jgi:hypothetical protein